MSHNTRTWLPALERVKKSDVGAELAPPRADQGRPLRDFFTHSLAGWVPGRRGTYPPEGVRHVRPEGGRHVRNETRRGPAWANRVRLIALILVSGLTLSVAAIALVPIAAITLFRARRLYSAIAARTA